jgi:hypothetical protein
MWYLVGIQMYTLTCKSHLKLKNRAGLFWAAEGAVALGYPEISKRGKYMK